MNELTLQATFAGLLHDIGKLVWRAGPGKRTHAFAGAEYLKAHIADPKAQNFLRACNALNTAQRNTAAHQLHAVLEEDIKHDCFFGIKHYGSAEIVQKLGELLAQAYPDVCDKSLFRIYDRCDDYIKAHLQLGAANL